MHGAFDDKEPEPAKSRRDAELTLGTGTLLAIIFGLVLLCVLCFGLGYTVGHSSSQEPVAATQPADSPQTASQATGAPPKPSATGQTGAAAAAQSTAADSGAGQASDAAESAASDTDAAASSRSSEPAAAGGASAGQSQARPAQAPLAPVRPAQAGLAQAKPVTPLPANPPQPPQAASGVGVGPKVRPALTPALALMVQIAAVSHVEDAQVLVDALHKKGYTVTAQRKPEDGLIHVWIGPFSSRDEANRWRMELQDDGYNAIVQP